MEEDAQSVQISNNPKPFKGQKLLPVILVITIIFLAVLGLGLTIYTWDRGVINQGVVISGIPLGHLRIEEAQKKLEENKKKILDCPVHFTTPGKTISISMGELGLSYNYDAALQQAYQIGRKGIIFRKAYSKFIASWGITCDPQYQWNQQSMKEALTKHIVPLSIPAEDARFTITADNSLEIIPDKLGRQADFDSLCAIIKKLTPNQKATIPIPFTEVTPGISTKELESLKTANLFSTYSTKFDSNLTGRTENIRLAAKTIDCKVLKPDQEFSFNQTVGPRTVESGYQMAIIIEGNEFVPGLGGGVCQVSSTLYNAVRLANLTVTERSGHSIPITYVPPGRDATVAYPDIDFRFKNDSGGYILIRSDVTDDTLTFSIYLKKT